jgi:4-hydroxy-tetrahydrodipicolinate synthase
VGTISVESHWAGELVSEMTAAFFKGDVDHARLVNTRLIPSHLFQSSDEAPNPVPAKAMMRTLGLDVGRCRPPLGPDPDGIEDRARWVLDQMHA